MITEKEVQHIADLARIGLNKKEIKKFSADLSSILDWIKQLEEVDIEKVKPMAHIIGINNVTREDKVEEFVFKKEIVKLFPEKKDGYDRVKSVL